MDIGHRLRDIEDEDSGLLLTDVIDLVEHAHPDSAIYRAVYVEESAWDLSNQLQALQADALHSLLWQNGGGKGRKPKPVPRPGVEDKATKTYRVKKKSTMAEIDAWLASRGEPQTQEG